MRQPFEQYYTESNVAKACVEAFLECVPNHLALVDPSAGAGAFMKHCSRIQGYDIDPKRTGISTADFFDLHFEAKKTAIVSNPPFGRNNATLIRYLNHALDNAQYCGVVVPRGFRLYTYQQHIREDAYIVLDRDLPKFSFELGCGKPFDLNAAFQIWTTKKPFYDMRNRTRPRRDHEDFQMRVANGTEESKKFFDEPFDFAVSRNAHNRKVIYDRQDLDTSKQYMFFLAHSIEAKDMLVSLPWNKLGRDHNSTVPNYSKDDVIRAYEEALNAQSRLDL